MLLNIKLWVKYGKRERDRSGNMCGYGRRTEKEVWNMEELRIAKKN